MAHQTALLIVPGTCPDSTTWPPPPVNWRWHTPSFSCHCRERRGQLPKVGGGICKAESVWPPAAAGCPLLCSLLSDWPQHAGYPPMLGHPPAHCRAFALLFLLQVLHPDMHTAHSLGHSWKVSLCSRAWSACLRWHAPPTWVLCTPLSAFFAFPAALAT